MFFRVGMLEKNNEKKNSEIAYAFVERKLISGI